MSELYDKALRRGVPSDEIAKVLVDGLSEGAGPLVDRLLKKAPKMLRNRTRIRRNFEKRLRNRWGKAIDLFRSCLEVSLEAGSDFNQLHRQGAAVENDTLFEAVTRLHSRACLTAFEVHRLLETGFSDAAYARWRTLYELAVVASLLTADAGGKELAERFLLYETVEHARDAANYQQHAAALGYEPFDEETMHQHEKNRETLEARFGKGFMGRNGWASSLFEGRSPSFAEISERAGMAHMSAWSRLSGHKIHAGAKGAGLNIKQRGPHTLMLAGPSNGGLADPGHGALIALYQVTVSLLLGTRVAQLTKEPLRLVQVKALEKLVELAGQAFLAAHLKLEEDERAVWAN